MHIECDHCGAEVEKEEALRAEYAGDTYYFCSVKCQEAKDYTPGHDDPEEESDAPIASGG